jgi:hypothetical protein
MMRFVSRILFNNWISLPTSTAVPPNQTLLEEGDSYKVVSSRDILTTIADQRAQKVA